MIALKIIAIVLAVILALIAIVLALRITVMLGYCPEDGFVFKVRLLCFSFGGKKGKSKPKKEKKPSRFSVWMKKKLGVMPPETDSDDAVKKSISEKVTSVVTFITLFFDQFKWLFSKMRLDKLKIAAVCSGGDASDAAMEYGLVCATVYPLIGYITGNINTKPNAEDVQIGCDFDGNTYFSINVNVSVRTIHLVRAAIRALGDISDLAEATDGNNATNTKEEKQ